MFVKPKTENDTKETPIKHMASNLDPNITKEELVKYFLIFRWQKKNL